MIGGCSRGRTAVSFHSEMAYREGMSDQSRARLWGAPLRVKVRDCAAVLTAVSEEAIG